MENRCIDYNGEKLWISRHMAVMGMIVGYTKSEDFLVLITKRGKNGTHPGKWCMPCGYLDYDETLIEAITREVKEEVSLDITDWELIGINDDPKSFNQNVTIRYTNKYLIDFDDNFDVPLNEEVVEAAIISIDDVDNFEWAFNHDKIIKEYYDSIIVG